MTHGVELEPNIHAGISGLDRKMPAGIGNLACSILLKTSKNKIMYIEVR